MRPWGMARISVVAASLLLLVAGALPAFAYQGQVPAQILLSGRCSGDQLVATVLDSSGQPVSDVNLTFNFILTVDAGDSVAPTTATTDANGKAAVGLTIANVAGTRVIQVVAGDLSATITLTCHQGLPPTSTDPVGGPGPLPYVLLLLASLLAVAGVVVWRRPVHS